MAVSTSVKGETNHAQHCLRSTIMKRIPTTALFLAVVIAAVVDPTRGQDSSHSPSKTAIFAGGCFWCIQPAFDKATGVIKTVVGYSGGTEPNPTYERVSSEKTGYRESIEITYDPIRISYDQLPQSSTAIMRKKRLPKHQKRSSRAPENSTNRS